MKPKPVKKEVLQKRTEMLDILEDFQEAVFEHNKTRKNSLEDDIELTIENLIKWLRFNTIY